MSGTSHDARDAIMDCTRLPPGWDSYDGAPTSQAAAVAALRLLSVLTTAPAVVPCSDGGVQLEWHTQGVDIEIACGADGTIEWWAVESGTR
jgi:hypothetical protein